MSRRTAESNKAILEAWNKEQMLVQEGKGTREWTPEQQKDILEKGKAYDDDGVAFQGQHMKSVEMYPEYQGDPGNIQFLPRAEHLEAHNGNWKNPTNWYFNPITKEKIDFGDGPFIPCTIVQLPEPIDKHNLSSQSKDDEIPESVKDVERKKETKSKPDKEHKKATTVNNASAGLKQTKVFGNTSRKVYKAIVNFSNRHPILSSIVKVIGVAGLAVAAEAVSNSGHSGSNSGSDDNDYNPLRNRNNTFINTYEDTSGDDTADVDSSIKRSSPDEHTVRGHGQHYHYKDGRVKWKEKEPYSRGGNKVE